MSLAEGANENESKAFEEGLGVSGESPKFSKLLEKVLNAKAVSLLIEVLDGENGSWPLDAVGMENGS